MIYLLAHLKQLAVFPPSCGGYNHTHTDTHTHTHTHTHTLTPTHTHMHAHTHRHTLFGICWYFDKMCQ